MKKEEKRYVIIIILIPSHCREDHTRICGNDENAVLYNFFLCDDEYKKRMEKESSHAVSLFCKQSIILSCIFTLYPPYHHSALNLS